MTYTLNNKLVVAITSRALFDLEEANRIFAENNDLAAYREYELENEEVSLKPGTGYPLVKALLRINEQLEEPLIEVVLVSRNDADSGLRIFNSIETLKLPITRAAFTDGRPPYPYLPAFCTKLFLSAYPDDVASALGAGVPAALVYAPPLEFLEADSEVRIAFDGDAVLFSDDSEKVYEQKGLLGFQQHELKYQDVPLAPGPFKPFLDAIAAIQARFDERNCPIRTALITARNAPTHKRPIKTLRNWKIRLDESFFLGGVEKSAILEIFKPHIFFDDQEAHLKRPSAFVPVAQVLRKKTGA